MFGSVILEIAIGLGLLYAVLSIAASATTEGIASLFAMRARTLRNSIVRMLGSEEDASDLLRHPLVRSVSPKRPAAGPAEEVPDTIAPQSFATALLERLVPSHHRPSPKDTLSRIDGVENESLRRTLRGLASEAGADWGALRNSVVRWFEDAMDRTRVIYAKRAATTTLIVAFVGVSILNADTIMFSQELWKNANFRALLASQAEGLDFDEPNGGLSLEESVALLGFYPLGWSSNPDDPRAMPIDFRGWLSKVGGLILTVLAISMGAPFWFDALRQLVAVRAGGRLLASQETPERSLPSRSGAPLPPEASRTHRGERKGGKNRTRTPSSQ